MICQTTIRTISVWGRGGTGVGGSCICRNFRQHEPQSTLVIHPSPSTDISQTAPSAYPTTIVKPPTTQQKYRCQHYSNATAMTDWTQMMLPIRTQRPNYRPPPKSKKKWVLVCTVACFRCKCNETKKESCSGSSSTMMFQTSIKMNKKCCTMISTCALNTRRTYVSD